MCKFDIDCRFLLYIRNQKSKNILYGKNRIVYFFTDVNFCVSASDI